MDHVVQPGHIGENVWSETVPLNPLRLVTVMADVPLEPALSCKLFGLAVMPKSEVGEDGTVKYTIA